MIASSVCVHVCTCVSVCVCTCEYISLDVFVWGYVRVLKHELKNDRSLLLKSPIKGTKSLHRLRRTLAHCVLGFDKL